MIFTRSIKGLQVIIDPVVSTLTLSTWLQRLPPLRLPDYLVPADIQRCSVSLACQRRLFTPQLAVIKQQLATKGKSWQTREGKRRHWHKRGGLNIYNLMQSHQFKT